MNDVQGGLRLVNSNELLCSFEHILWLCMRRRRHLGQCLCVQNTAAMQVS